VIEFPKALPVRAKLIQETINGGIMKARFTCSVPGSRWSLLLAAVLCLGLASMASAQDLASFEKRITVKTLGNGMTLIVCERPEAPVFSFYTHVNAGAAQEVDGISGVAHMFEHMAFKGTEHIGTTDFAKEKVALENVEKAYAAWDAERRREPKVDEAKVVETEKAFRAAIDKADKFVVKNEFGEIVDREGGVGLNAYTNWDETGYFYSLPSNRLELWAYLESERFAKPVFRDFYKERDVVQEERRMRTDSNPIGRLIEQFCDSAFAAHPYRRPVVGWMSDLQAFSATDAKKFYATNYVPSNIVVTVVGDVKAADVIALAERYFGRIPKAADPEPLRTVEPKQIAEKLVTIFDPSQPFYIEGYHKGNWQDPDDAVYDAISDILSNGRVSRLYRSLVRDKKIAAASAGFSGFPGQKYPNLFAFYGVPTPGHTNEEVRDAIRAEIEKLKTEDVTADELKMVKTRAKADLLRNLGSNDGLAQALGGAQARKGDWRELFRQVERIDKVTKEDIRRVASATFVATNRTVAVIETKEAGKDAKEAK
jgi:predicted Zn-dependent peptidase